MTSLSRHAGQGLVWGTLLLAFGIDLLVLPRGYIFPLFYAVPLFAAALTWRARAVALLLLVVTAAVVLTAFVKVVPMDVRRVGIGGVVILGALAVQTARLRAAAAAAAQAHEDFVAAAAHDLKNPLTVIRGEVYLLRRQLDRGVPASAATVVPRLAQIDGAAGRTLALVNGLLDAVQLQRGRALELVRRPADLVALVQQVAGMYQATTDQHRLVVEASVPQLVGQWDAFRLERVVENLLSNAIKFSPSGGEITLTVSQSADGPTGDAARSRRLPAGRATRTGPPGAWAVLRVRDQGVGIPAGDLRHIFADYHRGHNVAGKVPGTGIGLAGARRIVAQHGGTITVQSTEGRGTTFAVWLPLGTPLPSDTTAGPGEATGTAEAADVPAGASTAPVDGGE